MSNQLSTNQENVELFESQFDNNITQSVYYLKEMEKDYKQRQEKELLFDDSHIPSHINGTKEFHQYIEELLRQWQPSEEVKFKYFLFHASTIPADQSKVLKELLNIELKNIDHIKCLEKNYGIIIGYCCDDAPFDSIKHYAEMLKFHAEIIMDAIDKYHIGSEANQIRQRAVTMDDVSKVFMQLTGMVFDKKK